MDVSAGNVLLHKPFRSIGEIPLSSVLARKAEEVWCTVTQKAPRPLQLSLPPGTCSELDLHQQRISLADFGRSCRLQEANTAEADDPDFIAGNAAHRPPEEVLALRYQSPAYDMWRTGAMVYSLATGRDLFSPQDDKSFDLDERHLADMITLLGPLPLTMIERSPMRSVFFRRSGRLKLESQFKLVREPLRQVLVEQNGLEAEEADALSSFILPMLAYDPEQRATAAQMLQHPWLKRDEQTKP